MKKPEKLSVQRPGYRKYAKAVLNRALRRLWKQRGEDAQTKRAYRGTD